jgi:hypothetical protein
MFFCLVSELLALHWHGSNSRCIITYVRGLIAGVVREAITVASSQSTTILLYISSPQLKESRMQAPSKKPSVGLKVETLLLLLLLIQPPKGTILLLSLGRRRVR